MKTFEDCKKEVAKKRGWTNLVTGHKASYFEEAAEIYANQFKVYNIGQSNDDMENVTDVVNISRMNEYDTAVKLIDKAFIVISRQDLITE